MRKMRLIDADKLPATCNVAIVNGKLELNGWMAAERITEAPTVMAIPIEWVIELSNKLKNDEDDFEKAMFLLDLVDLWEKENETKTDRC